VLEKISALGGYNFSYNPTLLPEGSLFSFQFENIGIRPLLDKLFVGLYIRYSIDRDQIVLSRKEPQDVVDDPFFTISGTVREQDTHEPIPGVVVYLDGTTCGAVTNENGFFKIQNVPVGGYQIVVSHVAYKRKFLKFSKSNASDFSFTTHLEPKIDELAEIEITGTRLKKKQTDEYIHKLFEQQLLGNSPNAAECHLLNPEVLDIEFLDEGKIIKARASAPLQIENNALGYLLIVELDSFYSNNTRIKYTGQLRFEEMKPSNPAESKKWKTNRLDTYNGSMRHFFKSVVEGNYRKQGFRASFIDQVMDVYKPAVVYSKLDSFLLPSDQPLNWKIAITNRYLLVEYRKEL